MEKLYGLGLFSGIAGCCSGISDYVRAVAYCEINDYCQLQLVSRMATGDLPPAPVWDDVTTLRRGHIQAPVDIIYGGFPCQDISVAGCGVGLDGERSGLFFQVLRLCQEFNPPFVFLENVPAIRTRGGERVVKELSSLGYDCRWTTLSAREVGAPHKRERWFLLAYSKSFGRREGRPESERQPGRSSLASGRLPLADSEEQGLEGGRERLPRQGSWWAIEPDVGRVAHGVAQRVDRIRGLGNACVPQQAKAAFEELMFGRVKNGKN